MKLKLCHKVIPVKYSEIYSGHILLTKSPLARFSDIIMDLCLRIKVIIRNLVFFTLVLKLNSLITNVLDSSDVDYGTLVITS